MFIVKVGVAGANVREVNVQEESITVAAVLDRAGVTSDADGRKIKVKCGSYEDYATRDFVITGTAFVLVTKEVKGATLA